MGATPLSGATVGFLYENSQSAKDIDTRPWVAVLVGAGGAFLGAIIGSEFKSDRWETVPLDRMQIGIVPERQVGLRIGGSLKVR
jgi:hypothetical protein